MANRTRQETSAALRASCGCTGLVCVLVMACVLCLVPPRSGADEREDEDRGQQGKFCSATAHAVFRACGHEVQDTYWRAVASCINISDHAQRAHCFTDAKAARREGMDLCHTQRTERHAVCQALGEAATTLPSTRPCLTPIFGISRTRTPTSRCASATAGNTAAAPRRSRWRSCTRRSWSPGCGVSSSGTSSRMTDTSSRPPTTGLPRPRMGLSGIAARRSRTTRPLRVMIP